MADRRNPQFSPGSARQEVPTKFRVGDLIRVNTDVYSVYGVRQWSEHRVVRATDCEVFVTIASWEVCLLASDCSFVQRAPVRSHAAHHEDEIVGGAHFPTGKADAALAGQEPKDMVNLPDHYARFAIEPIRFIVENAQAFKDPQTAAIMSHVIPYLMRHEFKGGVQDLRKAQRLLDMLIALEEGDPDWWRVGRTR